MVLAGMGLDYLDLFLAHWPVTFQAGPAINTASAARTATVSERGEVLDEDGQIVKDWTHCCASIAATNGEQGSYVPTWREMQRLVIETDKVRAVGTSNFNIEQLQEVLLAEGDVPVSCNQIEAHPWLPNSDLIAFMRDHAILATAYSPFAPKSTPGPTLLEDPGVKRLAEKNGMGLGQLLQSWAVQRGTIPLGKSQTPGESNLAM